MSTLGLYKPSLHRGILGLLDGAHRHLQEENNSQNLLIFTGLPSTSSSGVYCLRQPLL